MRNRNAVEQNVRCDDTEDVVSCTGSQKERNSLESYCSCQTRSGRVGRGGSGERKWAHERKWACWWLGCVGKDKRWPTEDVFAVGGDESLVRGSCFVSKGEVFVSLAS